MTLFSIGATGADQQNHPATIAISTTTSGSCDLKGMGLVGFIMPAAFTGTTLTFQGSMDDENFYALYNSDNTAYSITVAVDRFYCLNPQDFLGMRYFKFVSGSSEAAAREIIAVMRSLQ